MSFTHLPLGSVVQTGYERPFMVVGYLPAPAGATGPSYLATIMPSGYWVHDGSTDQVAATYRVDARDIRQVLFLGWFDPEWSAYEAALSQGRPLPGPAPSQAKPIFALPMMKLLPLGTVVDIREGSSESRVMIGQLAPTMEGSVLDYLGYRWPSGGALDARGDLSGDGMAFFNARDIARVLFRGYVDDDVKNALNALPDYMLIHTEFGMPFLRDRHTPFLKSRQKTMRRIFLGTDGTDESDQPGARES